MRSTFLWSWLCLAYLLPVDFFRHAQAQSPPVVIAWHNGTTAAGFIRLARGEPPWDFLTSPLSVNRTPTLRVADGLIYVISYPDGTIQVVDPASWTITRTYDLGAGSLPVDIAVIDDARAYVTRHSASTLLRLDLASGNTTPVVDLAPYADADGNPDMGSMAVHHGRLFIALRRAPAMGGSFPALPGLVAVMDLATDQLIDAEPTQPGVQAIALEGFGPKRKMFFVPNTNRLLLTASAEDLVEGGVEQIDPLSLTTAGLVVRGGDGTTGLDIHTAVMVTPQVGYLTYTTDFALSSHVARFTDAGDVDEQLVMENISYEMPALTWNPDGNTLWIPQAGGDPPGVRVFDAASGTELTTQLIATSGPPTDIVVLCACSSGSCSDDWTCVSAPVPAMSPAGLAILVVTLVSGAAFVLTRKSPQA